MATTKHEVGELRWNLARDPKRTEFRDRAGEVRAVIDGHDPQRIHDILAAVLSAASTMQASARGRNEDLIVLGIRDQIDKASRLGRALDSVELNPLLHKRLIRDGYVVKSTSGHMVISDTELVTVEDELLSQREFRIVFKDGGFDTHTMPSSKAKRSGGDK